LDTLGIGLSTYHVKALANPKAPFDEVDGCLKDTVHVRLLTVIRLGREWKEMSFCSDDASFLAKVKQGPVIHGALQRLNVERSSSTGRFPARGKIFASSGPPTRRLFCDAIPVDLPCHVMSIISELSLRRTNSLIYFPKPNATASKLVQICGCPLISKESFLCRGEHYIHDRKPAAPYLSGPAHDRSQPPTLKSTSNETRQCGSIPRSPIVHDCCRML